MKIYENHQLLMDCPVCDKKHYVHIITREATAQIEGHDVVYPQKVYLCKMESRAEDEFIPARVMEENLAAAKKEYKKQYGKKAEVTETEVSDSENGGSPNGEGEDPD